MNHIILLIAQAQTLFEEASTDSVYVLIANVVMGGLLSTLVAWLNHLNGSKLKNVAEETANAKK